MFGQNIHIKYEKGESSGGMSYNTARRLYGNLDGIEDFLCQQLGCQS